MKYHVKTGAIVPFVQKYYKSLVAAVAAIFLLSVASMTLNASASTTVNGCSFDDSVVGIWSLEGNCVVTAQIVVPVDTTLEGNGHTMTAGFSNPLLPGNPNNSVVAIYNDNVTIQNVTLEGTGGSNLHLINTYESVNANVVNVRLLNSNRSGIVVNGTDVTVSGVTTVNSGWHGINVSQGSGVTNPSVLNIVGIMNQSEDTLDIYVDDLDDDFEVNDLLNQYSIIPGTSNDRAYIWNDITAPVVSDIVLNNQAVNSTDVRNANCDPITNFYPVSGEIDLSATITDDASDVANARYRVRKVNPNGCSNSTIFSSGFINMTNSSGDTWEDMPGFDTTTVPEDGEYTIFLQTTDSAGNTVTKYIDILVDNIVPPVPTNLNRVLSSNTSQSLACGDVATRQILFPTWDAYNESDFAYYEYSSFNNGTPGIVEQQLTTNQFIHNWTPPVDGTFGFRVRTVDTAGNRSDWSSICEITYDSVAPDVPTLVSPEDNAVVNGTVAIANDWEDVLGASSYIYRSFNVDEEGECIDEPVRFTANYVDSQTNSRTLPDGLSFCWQVKAVDEAGNESDWSERWKVTANNDPAVLGDSITVVKDVPIEQSGEGEVKGLNTDDTNAVLAETTGTLSDTGTSYVVYTLIATALIATTATLATVTVKKTRK